jgi:hypothetical protein
MGDGAKFDHDSLRRRRFINSSPNAHSDANTIRNAFCDPNALGNAVRNAFCDANPNAIRYTICDTNANARSDSYADSC